MAQVIVQVEADADDAWDNGSALTPAATSCWMGDYLGTDYDTVVRFQVTDVPQGATIDSAYLRFKCDGSTSGTDCNLLIWANDEDNPSYPANHAAYAALSKTTAQVAWVPAAWTADTWYDSSDIKTVIQEIVDRPGWAASQYMLLAVTENSATVLASRRAYSHNTVNADAPKLEINYTVAVTGGDCAVWWD